MRAAGRGQRLRGEGQCCVRADARRRFFAVVAVEAITYALSRRRALVRAKSPNRSRLTTVTYHLSRNGQPTGTCTKEEATARYARGEILPTDLVWSEGMANWTPASQVFGAATPPTPPAQPAAPTLAQPQVLPRPVAGDAGKPANNLVWAILATLLCCLPSGIVAIVYAAQVDSKWNSGDFAGAHAAAGSAKTWCWVSLGAGLLVNLGFGIFYALAVAGAVGASGY